MPTIRVVARHPLTYQTRAIRRGELFRVSPVEASVLVRQHAVWFALPDEPDPPPPPPPPEPRRRRYRRRDLEAES